MKLRAIAWWLPASLTILALVMSTAPIAFASCTPAREEAGRTRVVVSIVPLADFVENVGGEKVDVAVMVPPGASPHTYEPSPSQLVEVSKAKLFVKVGSGVDFELSWMDKLIAANRDMLVVDASKGIELIEMGVQHSHERYPGGMDPHIWLSALNAKTMVENICNGLIEVDPKNRDRYVQNMEEYGDRLEQLDRDISNGLAAIKNRRFVVFHPAWGYFARDYDLEQIPIEVGGKEPSAEDLAHLIEEAKENNIKLIFASPQFSVKSAEVIAREIDGRVVLVDPLARDYIKNLHMLLGELVEGLE